jgi:hypothetical protein
MKTFNSINVNNKHEAMMESIEAMLQKCTTFGLSPAWREVICNVSMYRYLLSNVPRNSTSGQLADIYSCQVLGDFFGSVLLEAARIFEESDSFAEMNVYTFIFEDKRCKEVADLFMVRSIFDVLRYNSPFDLLEYAYELDEVLISISMLERVDMFFDRLGF